MADDMALVGFRQRWNARYWQLKIGEMRKLTTRYFNDSESSKCHCHGFKSGSNIPRSRMIDVSIFDHFWIIQAMINMHSRAHSNPRGTPSPPFAFWLGFGLTFSRWRNHVFFGNMENLLDLLWHRMLIFKCNIIEYNIIHCYILYIICSIINGLNLLCPRKDVAEMVILFVCPPWFLRVWC